MPRSTVPVPVSETLAVTEDTVRKPRLSPNRRRTIFWSSCSSLVVRIASLYAGRPDRMISGPSQAQPANAAATASAAVRASARLSEAWSSASSTCNPRGHGANTARVFAAPASVEIEPWCYGTALGRVRCGRLPQRPAEQQQPTRSDPAAGDAPDDSQPSGLPGGDERRGEGGDDENRSNDPHDAAEARAGLRHRDPVRIAHRNAEQDRDRRRGGRRQPEIGSNEAAEREQQQPGRHGECLPAGERARDAAEQPRERQYEDYEPRMILAAQAGEQRERERRDQVFGRQREVGDAVVHGAQPRLDQVRMDRDRA